MFGFLNPEVFQGSFHKRGYFEGWYYKLVSRDLYRSLSIIPGISTAKGDAHAFIQVISSHPGKTAYFRFPPECFSASRSSLSISVGPNRFSASGMSLDLCSTEARLSGALTFSEAVPFPKSLLRRGIMGPFGYVPFMECYHGIAHIRHTLAGSLLLDGNLLDFEGGRGYIEKDWGRSFPSSWIWLQSDFPEENATLMFSMADIPFMRRRFCGILSFLYMDGRYYSIATYNGARFAYFNMDDDMFSLEIRNNAYALALKALRVETSSLRAPVNGNMQRTIEETLNAKVAVSFRTVSGEPLFCGGNSRAGLEICGDMCYLLSRARFA